MKWMVLAIIVGIAVYTYLTLHYRKPGPAYRPYEDFANRANVERLLNAGYRRIETTAERPADTAQVFRAIGAVASVTNAPGGLPGGLSGTFLDQPRLPEAITSVSAPRQVAGLLPYPILFNCAVPNQKEQLGGSQVFIRANTITIVPQFEALAGGLIARTKDSTVAVTIPGGTLVPGRYTVTLAATSGSKQWTVDVK
jgi:hypothetical protein